MPGSSYPEHRRWLTPVVVVGLGLLAGCGGFGSGHRAPVTRWIETDPDGPLDRSGLVVVDTVYRIDPAGAWQPEPGTSGTLRSHGLELDLDGRWGGVVHAVDLDASDVAAVEVSVEHARRVMVDWAREGEQLSPERRVELRISPHAPSRSGPIRLRVADHPAWSGRIVSLRVGVVRPPERRTVTLGPVQAVSERLRPGAVDEIVGRAWKVDLGSDVRNAVAALPGSPLATTLQVPSKAELRFGYGVEARQHTPVTFLVGIDGGDGDPVEVFRAVAGGDREHLWHDAIVDLSGYGGRSVRLVLDTIAEQPLDPAVGLPIWANPQVVAPAVQTRPNVVLISVDTLRADRTSMYGYRLPTTPELDAWAADSAVVFERTVVQAPWTLPSHVSLFTGLESFHHGVNFRRLAPPRLEMMAEYLRRGGYATLAVTGGGFVHPSFGFWQGFDSYRYWSSRYHSEHELDAGIGQAIAWLEANGDQPFFLFFHTFEVHGPYRARQPYYDRLGPAEPRPPEGVIRVMDGPVRAADGFVRSPGFFTLESPEGSDNRRRLGGEDIAMVSRTYDSQIAYTDHRIAELLRQVNRLGPALVVFTSDHGETIGERGDAGHGPLDDANLMVPLAIAFADGRGAGRRIATQVRSTDILPTLLESLGIEPRAEIDGESLLPLLDRQEAAVHRPAWSYNPTMNLGIALRLDDQYKYHFNDTAWQRVAGSESAFDLWLDPMEERPLQDTWDDIEEARRLTAASLEGAMGWRLRLANDSDGAVRLRLESGALQPAKVKILPGASGSVRWRGAGAAEVTVAAGGEVTIALLAAELGSMTVSSPRVAPGSVALTAPSGVERIRRVLTRAGWTEGAADGVRAVLSAELWRVGLREAAAPQPDEDDSELRQRLEALGYVQ